MLAITALAQPAVQRQAPMCWAQRSALAATAVLQSVAHARQAMSVLLGRRNHRLVLMARLQVSWGIQSASHVLLATNVRTGWRQWHVQWGRIAWGALGGT